MENNDVHTKVRARLFIVTGVASRLCGSVNALCVLRIMRSSSMVSIEQETFMGFFGNKLRNAKCDN